MSDLVAMLRQLVRQEISRYLPSHIGVVEAVRDHADSDTVNYACDVKLRGRDATLYGVPLTTDHLGTVVPPVVGDVVLVHFVEGNPDQPVIGGRLYSDQLRPPKYSQGQVVLSLPPSAPDSDRIDLTMQGGKSGSRSWELKLPDKITISVTDSKIEVTADALKLTLDAEGKQATLETGSATISADGNGNVKIQGNAGLNISSNGNIEIKAGGNLSLQATGQAELKGAMVKLN